MAYLNHCHSVTNPKIPKSSHFLECSNEQEAPGGQTRSTGNAVGQRGDAPLTLILFALLGVCCFRGAKGLLQGHTLGSGEVGLEDRTPLQESFLDLRGETLSPPRDERRPGESWSRPRGKQYPSGLCTTAWHRCIR